MRSLSCDPDRDKGVRCKPTPVCPAAWWSSTSSQFACAARCSGPLSAAHLGPPQPFLASDPFALLWQDSACAVPLNCMQCVVRNLVSMLQMLQIKHTVAAKTAETCTLHCTMASSPLRAIYLLSTATQPVMHKKKPTPYTLLLLGCDKRRKAHTTACS